MSYLDEEMDEVLDKLSVLAPTPAEAPPPANQMLAKVRRRVDSSRQSFTFRLRSWFVTANKRTATAVILLTALFAFALSIPAVRAAASDFLGLFRVQKFAAISVSPEQLAVLEQLANEGLTPGVFEILEDPGSPVWVTSLAEAARESGLTPGTLPSLGTPERIAVTGKGLARLVVDLEGARAIAEAAGADSAILPDSLDGAIVEVGIPRSVEQRWTDGTMLLQARSPWVQYPEDLDPTLMGQTLLQVLGLSELEARRLARSIDWTSTLVLPLPQDAVSFSEVTVAGVSGVALSSLDGHHGAVVWQKDDRLYFLSGNGRTAELIELAGSIQ